MALGIIAGIAQAAVGFAQAQQQANEQNAYYESNRRAAIAAADSKYAAINANTIGERASASAELTTKRIEAAKAKATAFTAAGEGGVTGLSVNALMGDVEAQHARQQEAIELNYENKKQANIDEGEATYHDTISRINSVRQASNPSPLPFIVSGLGSAIGAMK